MIIYNHDETRSLIKEAGAEKVIMCLLMNQLACELSGSDQEYGAESLRAVVSFSFETDIIEFYIDDEEDSAPVLSFIYDKLRQSFSLNYEESSEQDAKNLLICLRSLVEDSAEYDNYRPIFDLMDDKEDRSYRLLKDEYYE